MADPSPYSLEFGRLISFQIASSLEIKSKEHRDLSWRDRIAREGDRISAVKVPPGTDPGLANEPLSIGEQVAFCLISISRKYTF